MFICTENFSQEKTLMFGVAPNSFDHESFFFMEPEKPEPAGGLIWVHTISRDKGSGGFWLMLMVAPCKKWESREGPG